MNFDEYKITEEEVSAVDVKGCVNPLGGTEEENKDIFDKYPNLIRKKFDGFVQKMSDRYGNIGDVSTEDKLEDKEDGLYLVTFEGKKSLMLVSSGAKVIISADGSVYEYSSEENDFNLVSSLKTSEQYNNEDEFFKPFSVKGANALANAIYNNGQEIINLNVNKVDKEEGKGLSSNDYTDAEKQQLENNAADIEKLNFYGRSDVYILKEGVDIEVVDGEVVTLINNDYSDYNAIAFPEGITEIALPRKNRVLKANKVIFPKSLRAIGYNCFANDYDDIQIDDNNNIVENTVKVNVKEYIFNEGIETIEEYAFYENVCLEKVNIPKTVSVVRMGAFEGCDSLKRIVIPATVEIEGRTNFLYQYSNSAPTIYGYAGSYAETYAKENEIPFVNIGSDYSKQIATPDWNQSDETQPDYIKNKPIAGSILYVSIVDGVLSILQDSPKYTSSIIDNVLIVN